MRLAFVFAALAIVSSLAGCRTVSVEDDIDYDFDFKPFSLLADQHDHLRSPYVTGAKFTFTAESSDDDEDTGGWRLTSSNPSVLTVLESAGHDNSGRLNAQVAANEPRAVEVTLRDKDGALLRVFSVNVAVPDRVEVLARGPLLIGRAESEADTAATQVLVGGTATFLVKWFAGAVELRGNGALSVASTPSVEVKVAQTFWSEVRDWLQITPHDIGPSQDLQLSAGIHPVRVLGIKPVGPESIASLRILGENEAGATKQQMLVTLAQAYDATGDSIYGVDYTWKVDGHEQWGEGDLYRYEYNPTEPAMLTASYGGMNAQAMIHAGQGFVDSTNNLGCAVGSGRPRAPLAPLALAALLAIAIHRRGRRMR